MEQTLKEILKQKLIDWIDRPPSNDDLDVIDLILDLVCWTKYKVLILGSDK